jgi:hypothetical protein
LVQVKGSGVVVPGGDDSPGGIVGESPVHRMAGTGEATCVRNLRSAWWQSSAWHSPVLPRPPPVRRARSRSSVTAPSLATVVLAAAIEGRAHSRCSSWSVRQCARTRPCGPAGRCHDCRCASGTETGGARRPGSRRWRSNTAVQRALSIPWPCSGALPAALLPRAGRLTREPFPAPQQRDRKRWKTPGHSGCGGTGCPVPRRTSDRENCKGGGRRKGPRSSPVLGRSRRAGRGGTARARGGPPLVQSVNSVRLCSREIARYRLRCDRTGSTGFGSRACGGSR